VGETWGRAHRLKKWEKNRKTTVHTGSPTKGGGDIDNHNKKRKRQGDVSFSDALLKTSKETKQMRVKEKGRIDLINTKKEEGYMSVTFSYVGEGARTIPDSG